MKGNKNQNSSYGKRKKYGGELKCPLEVHHFFFSVIFSPKQWKKKGSTHETASYGAVQTEIFQHCPMFLTSRKQKKSTTQQNITQTNKLPSLAHSK